MAVSKSTWREIEIRPVDVVMTLYFLANLMLVGLFYDRLPLWKKGLLGYSACLLIQALIVLAPVSQGRTLGARFHRFLRDWYPYIFTGWLYTSIIFVSYAVIREPLDQYLITADRLIFGGDISVYFHQEFNSRFFYELMHFFYFYFYFFTFTVSYFIYRKDKEEFQRFYFVLMLMLVLQYYFFTIIPTAGPKFGYAILHGQHLPARGPFSWIMHELLSGGEIPAGAFPSSHVSITLISTLYAQKVLGWRKSWFFWTMFTGLFFSTVYTQQHYGVDPIGGALYAIFMYKAGEFLYDYILLRQKEREARRELA